MNKGQDDNIMRMDAIIDPEIAAAQAIDGWIKAVSFLILLLPGGQGARRCYHL